MLGRRSALYVYAITGSSPELPDGLAGIGGACLQPVVCRSLAAIASQVDPTQVCPNAERVLGHEHIVEALCQRTRVLPVRYGTVLPDAGTLVRALDERYETLLADLARLGGKVELGLRVLWNPDALESDDQGSTPAASQGSGEPVFPRDAAACVAGGRGTSYLRLRLAEQRRRDDLRARANALGRHLNATLLPQAIDSRPAILPTDCLAVSSTYLLEPTRVAGFRESFERLRAAHPALRFLLSGPWPPYSFVTPPNDRPLAGASLRDLSALASALVGQYTSEEE